MPVRDNLYKASGMTPKVGPIDARVILIVPAMFLGLTPSTFLLIIAWVAAWIVIDLWIAIDLKTLGRVIRRRAAASGKAVLVIMPPINTRH